MVRLQQGEYPRHLVVDVAEAPGLAAVAVDRQRLALQGLDEEVRHDPTVRRPHPGAVGVEDADDSHVDAVGAVVGHGDGLGEPLGLVVDPTGSDRVHVAPVVLGLGMDLGVPVDLAGGGEEEPGVLGLGQPQAVVGAQAADLEGLDGQLQVVAGRGRAGKVEDGVDGALDRQGSAHIVADEAEVTPAHQVLDVGGRPGDAVVDADHLVAALQQPIAQVGAEEAGPARDHDPAPSGRPLTRSIGHGRPIPW